MKNLIKITALSLALTFMSAMVLSAQEHNHMHKGEKEKNSHKMMDSKNIDKNNDGIIYECPMKCEAATDMPGECSKCGMKLAKISVSYSNKTMKCEDDKKSCCGDKDAKRGEMYHSKMMEKHGKKMDHMNHKMENHSNNKSVDKNDDGIVYECPMKCLPASDKAGTCSKCGMNLIEVNVE
jgi:Heavy metal binding domain